MKRTKWMILSLVIFFMFVWSAAAVISMETNSNQGHVEAVRGKTDDSKNLEVEKHGDHHSVHDASVQDSLQRNNENDRLSRTKDTSFESDDDNFDKDEEDRGEIHTNDSETSDHDDDDDDDDETLEDDDERKMPSTQEKLAKEDIEKAMMVMSSFNDNTTQSARIQQSGKVLVRFVRRNFWSITATSVILVVFRKEIQNFISHYIGSSKPPVLDPKSGKMIRQSPFPFYALVDWLKLFLLLDFIRRLVSSSSSSPDPNTQSSAVQHLLFLFLTSGGHLFHPAWIALLLPLLLSPPKSSVFLPPVEQHYTFETINTRYTKDGLALQKALDVVSSSRSRFHSPKSFPYHSLFASAKEERKAYNGTTILLDMTQLDSSVSNMATLRDKISFILSENAKSALNHSSSSSGGENIEVAVLLESPGGSAPDYALAAQQLLRLRNNENITVTVLVDKVAASGGYMIACCSSPGKLYAAPFAVLGSIGVLGQTVNIQRTLEGWGVQPLVFRGGRDKAPVGLLGDITEEALAKVQTMVDNTHRAFQRHVTESRPATAKFIELVATGDTWLGYDAIHVGLIDAIMTSDDYISQRISQGALVLKILQMKRPQYSLFRPATEGLGTSLSTAIRWLSNLFGVLSQLILRAQSWIDTISTGADLSV